MAHKILFIAPLPPPVHGSSMVSKYIKESKLIQECFDCDFVNLSTSRTMDEIGKGGLKKIFRFLGSLLTLLGKLLTHRYDLCYIAITCHGMGFLKDAPFALLCKLFGHKLLLHQHNKGMSRDCNRWPYRWLMPLVYRNATVMLLSWHLYEDISSVVKREQVIVCANGVPPLDNENLAAELRATGNDEQLCCNVDVNANENENENLFKSTEFILGQQNLDTNLDTFTHTQACAGHPDEDTQSMYDNENDNANQQSETAINQRPEGAINRAEHFNRSAASLTGTEGAYPNLTQNSQNSQIFSINTNVDANSQNARIASLACAHPDGDSKLYTLTTQRSESNICLHNIAEQASGLKCETFINSKQNQPLAELKNQQSETAINQRPGGAINRAEHFNRSAASLTGTEGAPRLLFLSNLIVSKGIYVLLEACQRLKEQGVAFHCDYVGGESKEVTGEQFRKAIAERGLTDCVTYHGPQYGADKDRAFRRADIFVFPTFYDNECFPLVLVEAMQYRLPIVTTPEGGILDIVTDGVNGLVCKQQDVDSLVVALSTLLADPAMRQEMGERGHTRYLKEMTLEAFEYSFAEALRSTVKSHGVAVNRNR